MTLPRRMRIRFGEDDFPEIRCAWCFEWLPATLQYWSGRRTKSGRGDFARCLACNSEQSRLKQALRWRDDDEWRERRIRDAVRYRMECVALGPPRPRYRAWLVVHHPDLVEAYDRLLHQRNLDRTARHHRRVRRAA
jgi:hypothetical protein